MQFLADLEASPLSEWLSLSMLGFPTLIALHSVGMAVVVGLTLTLTLRLHGILPDIREHDLPRLLTIAVWGFSLNFVTGLALFITRGSEYIVSYIFLLKMLLVLVSAGIVFWLRRRLALNARPTQIPMMDRTAKSMALVATVLWFGAVVAGRLIAYLSDVYR